MQADFIDAYMSVSTYMCSPYCNLLLLSQCTVFMMKWAKGPQLKIFCG